LDLEGSDLEDFWTSSLELESSKQVSKSVPNHFPNHVWTSFGNSFGTHLDAIWIMKPPNDRDNDNCLEEIYTSILSQLSLASSILESGSRYLPLWAEIHQLDLCIPKFHP
jgi:hypothetical protein